MRVVKFLAAAAGLPLLVGLGHIQVAAANGSQEGKEGSKQNPIVINTWAFVSATDQAWVALSNGGSALDAVEEGCSTCERLQCDGTVGFGGSPDESGETTLDAMIMDGNSMAVGAVSDLRHVKHAISTARLVMETTQHSMLAGLQATQFAVDMGLPAESLTTDESAALHKKWLNHHCQPNFRKNVLPDPTTSCGPYHLSGIKSSTNNTPADMKNSGGLTPGDVGQAGGLAESEPAQAAELHKAGGGQPGAAELVADSTGGPCKHEEGAKDTPCRAAHAALHSVNSMLPAGPAGRGSGAAGAAGAATGGSDKGASSDAGRGVAGLQLGPAEASWPSQKSHDTIAMAAIDVHGNVAAGCSTNGAIHKVPGRVGDGSVPGGGAYADSEVGACGATGDGDAHLRFLPCYQVVENMRQGMNPQQAAQDAIRRIARRLPGYVGAVFAVDKAGNHGAACYGWEFKYAYRESRSEGVQVVTVAPLQIEQQGQHSAS